MKQKPGLADYFTFSRKDRFALAGFLLVTLLLVFLPALFRPRTPILLPITDSLLGHSLLPDDSPEEKRNVPRWEPGHAGTDERGIKASLFEFDPNTLDSAGWRKLGLTGRTAHTILKYRERGGHFRSASDLRRIWTLPSGFVDRIEPYVRVAEPRPGWTNSPAPKDNETARSRSRPQPVAINLADSGAWERLPGIGAKLAARIIRYRDRLGGFYKVDQVKETWGLPDSTFMQIRPYLIFNGDTEGLRKLNLNSATKEELKVHPYIRWQLANALVEYRARHGNYHSLEELKRVLILPDSTFDRIAPYLLIQ